MLHEFLSSHRDAILARVQAKLAPPSMGHATGATVDDGLPLFFDQLIGALRSAPDGDALPDTAARHGASLLHEGFTIADVVQNYGAMCQAVTELALETDAAIEVDEFRVFNRCLDVATAHAVTEFARRREQLLADAGREHQGELAHELRNALGTATMAFDVLKTGSVSFDGSTSAVLGRSLRRLAALIDGSLAEVRLRPGERARSEHIAVDALLAELAVSAGLQAAQLGLTLSVTSAGPEITVAADRQLLAAALENLLQNAFKFTRQGGRVELAASSTPTRVLVEVKDECGGLPEGVPEDLFRPFHQRSTDRSGLGLGLSLSRKSVEASGGQLRVRDVPGLGCVFAIDLPRLVPGGSASAETRGDGAS